MKTTAWEAAPQIALRNCSKGAVGGKSIYKVLVKTAFSTICSLVSKESASKFQEIVKDRGAWRAAVQGVANSWT